MEGFGGVLQLQDMASVNRNCIPAPALCFWRRIHSAFPAICHLPSAICAVSLADEVNIPHFPPSALSVWQEMEV